MQFDSAADIPPEPRATNAVKWLIGANVALYFLQLTVLSPGDVRNALGFEMHNLSGAWWTVVTYMFVHAGFMHLALNMYTLWLFGPRVERLLGSGQFAGYYLVCGLGGWFFHILFAQQGVLIGASAAVLGVMLAYASRWPDEHVFLFGVIPLTVRWLVALLIVANLVGGMASMSSGAGVAYLAHLGGLAAGWGYLRMAGSLDIDRLRQRIAPVADEPEETPPRAFPRSLPRQRGERDAREVDEIVEQSHAAIAERAAPERGRPSRTPPGGFSSTELNSLLDKISAHGLDALTQSERKRLEDAARKLRNQ
jgi:membrane associated rhomboid family serine protease